MEFAVPRTWFMDGDIVGAEILSCYWRFLPSLPHHAALLQSSALG